MQPHSTSQQPPFILLDAGGAELASDASEFAAFFDPKSDLIWSAKPLKAKNWKHGQQVASEVQILGEPARLPEHDELRTLINLAYYRPAVHPQIAKIIDLSDWYWSNTPLASAPDSYAWYVNFNAGSSSGSFQFNTGLVLAVRSASQSLSFGREAQS